MKISDFFCIKISAKIREKSRECHNHKMQPFPDNKRKRKQTKPNKPKSNKRTKSTKISSLFQKQGDLNAQRTEKTQEQNNTRQNLFLWDHWAHSGYFENKIPLKPALGGVCSLANYKVAHEETQSNRVSDFRDFVCSLFPKAIVFDF